MIGIDWGGWSGFGTATVGIHPNDFNLNPNKIPTGGEVQNCREISEESPFVEVLHQNPLTTGSRSNLGKLAFHFLHIVYLHLLCELA